MLLPAVVENTVEPGIQARPGGGDLFTQAVLETDVWKLRWVLSACMLCFSVMISAATPAAKPFTEKKIVLQISDQDA